MPETHSLQPSRLALVMGGFLFLAGFIFVIGSWGAYWLDTGIEKSGLRAEGYVTKKSVLFASDGASDYVLKYRFKLPNGERVEAHRSIDKRLWRSLREGENFVVYYSAQDPNRNFPSGGGVTSIGVTIFVSVLGALFAVGGALLLRGALRQRVS